jgi:hypothetical protein
MKCNLQGCDMRKINPITVLGNCLGDQFEAFMRDLPEKWYRQSEHQAGNPPIPNLISR